MNGNIANMAAEAAYNYTNNEYNDWYLPSENELLEMSINIGQNSTLGNIGGFQDWYYWSSTESGSEGAWALNFTLSIYPESFGNYFKHSSTVYVRPVRSF